MVYLDYSATTPVRKEVLDTYVEASLKFIGNPNSLHKLGTDAKKLIESATRQIENILKIKDKEVIYTSGSSESNNMVIKGVANKYKNRGNHIISSYLEHSSILSTLDYLSTQGFIIDYVKIKDDGTIDLDHLKELLSNISTTNKYNSFLV